jgi:uncharacterized protein YbjT (DUF2867 family)
MKILLTGANGYIGRRLLPALLEAGHEVTCLVRDRRRFLDAGTPSSTEGDIPRERVHVIEGDLLDSSSLATIPDDLDAAYYLVHSMGSSSQAFPELERRSAANFAAAMKQRDCRRIIYLSGISNADNLSTHLASRHEVESILASESRVPVTVLRAAIIIGSGSASFEIIRDLVEKLPVMIAPKWLRTRCQPIAIRNVIDYLVGVLGNNQTIGRSFDIGGPDILTYQQMLLGYAAERGLKRSIIPVPFLTPRLSSYWLYFVTSTSFPLARSLVDSMKNEVICAETTIRDLIPLELIPYRAAVARAFGKIEQGLIPSSWTDALSSGSMESRFLDHIRVPGHGVLTDRREVEFERDPDEVRRNLWKIGGDNGWYAMDWAWRLRGAIDKVFGGTGLRRGRRHPTELRTGDALDFWRVLVADAKSGRLVLFAEMKLPGEAWLEWQILADPERPAGHLLRQTATFRPSGLAGRLYWYSISPLHTLVFEGMARAIVERRIGEQVDQSGEVS